MVKFGVAGNRLSLGSWSIPIARTNSQRKSQSRSTSAMAVPISKAAPALTETELSNTSTKEDHFPPTNLSTLTKVSAEGKVNMVELAQIITRETGKLDKYLKDNGSDQPGFDVDSPANFPKLPAEIKKAREEIVRATKELGDLVTGPTESVRWMAWEVRFFSLPNMNCTDTHSITIHFHFMQSITIRLVLSPHPRT